MTYFIRGAVLGLVLLCASFPALAAKSKARPKPVAQAGGGVPVVPRWKAGDAWDLEVTRSSEDRRDDKVVRSSRFTMRVAVTVKEARPDGYLIEWRVREVSAPADAEMTTDQSHARTLLAARCPLLLEAGRTGNPTGLRNPADVRRALEKRAGTVAAASMPADERKQVEAMMRKAYASDASLFTVVAKEFGILTNISGVTFREREPIRFEVKLPSPLGNAMIPASGSVVMTKHDAAAGTATVETQLVTDPARTAAAMRQGLRAAAAGGAPAASEQELRELTSAVIEDRSEHVIALASGWPAKLKYRRVIRGGNEQRLDGMWVTSTPVTAGIASGQEDVK